MMIRAASTEHADGSVDYQPVDTVRPYRTARIESAGGATFRLVLSSGVRKSAGQVGGAVCSTKLEAREYAVRWVERGLMPSTPNNSKTTKRAK